ncbi:hypothetical protein ABK040_012388 [Willaertia magna]
MPRHSLLHIVENRVTRFENEMIPLKNLTIKSIKLGSNFLMILTDNGLIFGYGNNRNGEIGLGKEVIEVHKEFTQILNLENKIKLLECGYQFTFIVDEFNQLYFTGLTNVLFENEEQQFTFTKIVTNEINEEIKLIRVAYGVIFIVTESNLIYVRGRNYCGQLGLGHTNSVFNSFVKNSSLQHVKIKDLKCADYHAIILDDDGIVYCSGENLSNNEEEENINYKNNNKFYFKPFDFLQSKIKSISVTDHYSILYAYNNELIITNHYKIPFNYTVLVLPMGMELKSIYGDNLDTEYSALITKENKIYSHSSNEGLLFDSDYKIGDFTKLDDSLLLNTLNLPNLYVVGTEYNSMFIIYTDYLICEEIIDNKNLNLYFKRLKNQLFDFKNLVDVKFSW